MSDEHPSARPWWQLRPAELTGRYGFDADERMGAIDAEDLPDWQLAPAFDALELCQEAGERSNELRQLGSRRDDDPTIRSRRADRAWIRMGGARALAGSRRYRHSARRRANRLPHLRPRRHPAPKVAGAEPNDTFRAVVTERRDDTIVLESYFEDECGNEFGPLEER